MDCCPRPDRLRRASGPRAFSIIEVLVVLGLVLALSAASVPVFRLVANDAAGVEAERTIGLVLRGAQYHASDQGRAMRVAVADGGDVLRVVHDHGADDDAVAMVVDEWRLPDGAALVGVAGGVVPETLAVVMPTRGVREGDPCVLEVGGAVVRLEVGSASGGEPVRFVRGAAAGGADGAGDRPADGDDLDGDDAKWDDLEWGDPGGDDGGLP